MLGNMSGLLLSRCLCSRVILYQVKYAARIFLYSCSVCIIRATGSVTRFGEISPLWQKDTTVGIELQHGPLILNQHFGGIIVYIKQGVFFIKMGQPRFFSVYFQSFQSNITIPHQVNMKSVHPVEDAGIRTHNLLIKSLLP